MEEKFQYDQSQFHIKVYFDQKDLTPYINTFTKENGFPDLTKDQILDTFGIAVMFLQTLLLCKTNDKVLLELFEKPNHLDVKSNIMKISNVNYKRKNILGIF